MIYVQMNVYKLCSELYYSFCGLFVFMGLFQLEQTLSSFKVTQLYLVFHCIISDNYRAKFLELSNNRSKFVRLSID